MQRNYNKTNSQNGHMISNNLFIVIFYAIVIIALLVNDFYRQQIESKQMCTDIAQEIKNDVSYANLSGIKNHINQHNLPVNAKSKISPNIRHWSVTSEKSVLSQGSRKDQIGFFNWFETSHQCSIQDVRNTNSARNSYELTLKTLFRLNLFQVVWLLVISLLILSIPIINSLKSKRERTDERNLIIKFINQISERSQDSVPRVINEFESIQKIIQEDAKAVLNFIDETYEVNENYDPEYVTRLERNFIDLEERNAHLHIKNKALKRQTTLKSSFFANLSHDFRTPLYTIDGYSRLLLNTELERKQLSHVNSIQIANANLLELVSNFLSLSRLEAGKIDLELSKIDLRQMIKDIALSLSFLIVEHRNHFFIDVSDNLPNFIIHDAIKLRQILANLISNAVKYTRDGILYIHVACRKADEETLSISITVTDTGKGISEQDLKTIFDPYTRLDRDNTQIHGTGLGLGICKELCEALGAKLSVASLLNKGSSFIIDMNSTVDMQTLTYKKNKAINGKFFVFNSIQALDIYLSEWLKIISNKPQINSWETLLEKPESIHLNEEDKILILLNYATASSIKSWAKHLKKYTTNVIIYAPIDFLSSQEMRLLDSFIVLDNNTSNYELAYSINTRKKSPQQNFSLNSRLPLKGYVLLLAEDNDLNRKIIEEKLSSFGAKVISCPDGNAALELYKARDYSAILMDAHMPKISGIELTKMIRRDYEDTRTPIIGITASTSSVEYQHFISAGMSDCLIKPLQDRELINAIKKYSLSKSVTENILEKQDALFNEVHKLNGTLSMTSFKQLQKEINTIENLVNPVLWSSSEYSQDYIDKKSQEAMTQLKSVWPKLEEIALTKRG